MSKSAFFVAEDGAATGMVRVDSDPHPSILTTTTDIEDLGGFLRTLKYVTHWVLVRFTPGDLTRPGGPYAGHRTPAGSDGDRRLAAQVLLLGGDVPEFGGDGPVASGRSD